MAKNLDLSEKNRFLKLIQDNPAIWDLSCKGHRNNMALAGAWRNISEAMKRPVAECKAIYRSIKDGVRYKKKKQKQKSGSGFSNENLTPEESAAGDDEADLDMALSVGFLEPSSSKRSTFSTSMCDEESSDCVLLESNYNYATASTSKKASTSQKDSCDTLTTALAEIIKLKKERLDNAPTLKYMSMHMNLDRLYCQLSPQEVEELNHEFYNKTYEKVMKMV